MYSTNLKVCDFSIRHACTRTSPCQCDGCASTTADFKVYRHFSGYKKKKDSYFMITIITMDNLLHYMYIEYDKPILFQRTIVKSLDHFSVFRSISNNSSSRYIHSIRFKDGQVLQCDTGISGGLVCRDHIPNVVGDSVASEYASV